MGEPLITVSSITYAMKGKQILNGYGIKANVQRTPKRSHSQSCTYSLYVPDNPDEAEEILIKNGIKVIGRSERS